MNIIKCSNSNLFLLSSIQSLAKMQKHQEWIDNRSYEMHLECLKKIKARKNTTSNLTKRHKKHQHSRDTPNQSPEKENYISDSNFKSKTRNNSYQTIGQANHEKQTGQQENCKQRNYEKLQKIKKQSEFIRQKPNCFSSRNPIITNQNILNKNRKFQNLQKLQSKEITNISLKQQQLLWNNFLLGKRILQTSPVISKKKLDLEYQKHQDLLKSRTTKNLHQSSNFRLRKLQQHNDKIYKITDDHRIQNNLHKQFMVNLMIQSVEIFKFKFSSFENIIVVMKKSQPQPQIPQFPLPKKTKQVSECIPSSTLTSHNFFFTFKKKQFDQNLPIIVQIKNVKSLNVLSVGTFSFQFNQEKEMVMKEANLYNFGKLIGTVKFNAHFGRKNQFLSHVQ